MWKKIPSFIFKAIILLAFVSIALCMSFFGKDESRTNSNFKKLAILNGNVAMSFTGEGMYRGFILDDGKAVVKIYKE